MTSRVMVRPLRQTWMTARGVMVYAPEPTSLLVMTKPRRDHRQFVTAAAVERGAVPAQQRTGLDCHGLGLHTHVHAPVGQVATGHAGGVAGLPQPVQGGQQHVEVVHQLVAVRQQRTGHTLAGHAGAALSPERAQHETTVRLLPQPRVDVLVQQRDVVGPHAAQVGERDAQLVGDPFVGHGGGPVDPVDVRHTVRGDLGLHALDVHVALTQPQRGGGGDHVQLAPALVLQDADQVGEIGVAGTGGGHVRGALGELLSHAGSPSSLASAVRGRGHHPQTTPILV